MKQTNNAIKFLMAQYRAIFKNAYFKGLTSAVLLTAGLAAGSAQAATNIDETHWGNLTNANGVTTVTGSDSDDGTSGNYTDFSFKTTSGTYSTDAVQNILIQNKSGGNTVTATSSGEMKVIGTNTTITLQGSGGNAASGALSIAGSGANAATLDVKAFNVGVGELTLSGGNAASGDATLKAGTINLMGGTGSKITLNGTTGSGAAILQGRLTTTITDPSKLTEIELTGTNNILKTYGTDLQVNITITAAKETGANLNLTPDTGVAETAENQLLQIIGGNFDLQNSSTANSGATFTIQKGTLEIGDQVVLTSSGSNTSGAGTLKLSGTNTSDATLRMSSKQVTSFLSADKGINSSLTQNDGAGSIQLTKGTLELTDNVDLFEVFGSDKLVTATTNANANGAAGKIEVSSGDVGSAVIKGNELAISNNLGTGVSKLSVQADKITLTELTDSGSTNSLGVGQTIAASYDFKLNEQATTVNGKEVQADSAYTIGASQDLVYATTTTIDNPYQVNGDTPQGDDTITVAGTGTIGEDLIVSGNNAKLEIYAGHYSDANDITLSSGSLSIGGQSGADSQYKGVDASLTLENGATLLLDNTQTNTITIAGNGESDDWGTSSLGYDAVRDSTGVLDLTAGEVEFQYFTKAPTTGNAQSVTTFNVNDGGELVLRNDQVDYLLNNLRAQDKRNSAVSGSKIALDGGYLTVQGDLDLDVSHLATSGNQDVITFGSNGGALVTDGSITLTAKDGADAALNIGKKGYIKADTVALNNLNLNAAKDNFVDFEVKVGNIIVGSQLTSRNETVVFNNDGTNASYLQLGDIEHSYDQYGIPNGSYTFTADAGQVNTNLSFIGAGPADTDNSDGISDSSDQSTLKVEFGDWTVQNIEAKNALISVGGVTDQYEVGDPFLPVDENGELYTASLTGEALDLTGGTRMDVARNATVTFDTFSMAGNNLVVVDNTTMTINGKHTAAAGSTPESWGLSVTDGEIQVNGREGVLSIGSDALLGLSAVKQADGTFTYTNANTNNRTGFVTLDNWATLSLELDSNDVFGKESLEALRQAFITNDSLDQNGLIEKGFIDIGDARIDGITVTNGQVSWDVLEGYKDIIADIITQDISNATLIKVNGGDIVQANVGNVLADNATQVVRFNDSTLRKGADGFVKNEKGEVIGADVQSGSTLGLYNGGTIGDVTLQKGNDTVGETTLTVVSSASEVATEPETIIASVDGKGETGTAFKVQGKTTVKGKVDVGSLVVDKALTIKGEAYAENGLYSTETKDADGNVSLVNTGALTVNTLEVRGGADYAGSITATGAVEFGSEAENAREKTERNSSVDYYLAGNNTFTDVTFFHDTDLAKGKTIAKNVHLGQGLSVYDGATLDADVVSFTAGSTTGDTIFVGSPAETDASGNVTKAGTSGFMNIGRLDLAGRSLIVDPDYGSAASVVAIGQMGASGDATALLGNDAGTLNGSVIGLQNSIVGIGVTDTADQSAIEQLRTTFASYLDGNGSLSNAEGQVGAVVYAAKSLDLNENSKIVVDASRNAQQYHNLMNGKVTNPTQEQTDYVTAVNSNNVYLGANSVLALGQQALAAQTTTADGTKKDRAALHFNDVDASIYTNGGKVVLVGDYNVDEDLILFTDTGTNTGVKIVGPEDNAELVVESLSGLYVMTLTGETTGGKLEATGAHALTRFYAASEPVRALLNEYYLRESTPAEDRLVGERAPRNISYDASTQTFTDTTTNTTVTGYTAVPNGDGTYTIYENAYNEILNETVAKDFSGATAETAARMGAYAGVAQAALAAGASTYDSISSRMGIGAQSATMTFAENGQGAGLWLNPIYKSHDSDGFDAQGADYGVDMDLYGVALGADYTLANGLRFGAMFNVGSGDADGQGAGSAVSNDFDYYGFGAFVGYTMGALSVVGDVSYTAVDNDVEANLGFDKVGASLDSTNLSVGVTGKYALDLNGVSVTPHAGLRYSSIDIDDYSVDGEQTYAHFSSQSMDVFSIPVGVTVAKDIVAGSWTVKPSFDLTLTGNFGDDEFDGDVTWEGISNHVTQTSTEVLDNFTYGATLGVAAQTGNFSLGLGVNYTGSSNVDEFGVQANARFVF